jgi:ABC-type branched-subunit amino acid transport system permease subunit
MLPLAFAVVIIGGMGSLGGAAIGALAVGLADNFGKALFPEVSYFTLYAPMVLILAIKPTTVVQDAVSRSPWTNSSSNLGGRRRWSRLQSSSRIRARSWCCWRLAPWLRHSGHGLDILLGSTGLLVGGLFGVGAYSPRCSPPFHFGMGWDFWIVVILGILIGAALAAVFGCSPFARAACIS